MNDNANKVTQTADGLTSGNMADILDSIDKIKTKRKMWGRKLGREKQFVKSTMLLSLGVMLPRLVVFIAMPIYTNTEILSKADYGTYNLIATLASMLAPALTIQIQTAAFRFLMAEKDNKDIKTIVSNVIFFVMPISVVSLVVIFFCLHIFSVEMRLMIAVYIFLEMYYGVILQMLRGMGKNKEYSITTIINAVINIGVVIPMLLFTNMGLMGMLIALCAANIVSTLYMSISIRLVKYLDIKLVEKKCLKRMLSYSWPMVPNNASMWVLTASDQLIITAMMGAGANAVYSAATKFPQILTLAQNAFTMAWQESASMSTKDKDSNQYYNLIFDGLFRVMSGIMALLIGFMPLLFALFINSDYVEVYAQLPILLWGMFFYGLSAYYGGIYVAEMKVKNVALTTVIAAVLNIAINFAFIGRIGIYAASISTLISYVFMTIFRAIDTKKMRKVHCDWKRIVIFVVFLLIMCVLFYSDNTLVRIVNAAVGIVFCIIINKSMILSLWKMVMGKIRHREA